ncbi:MAG TPA: hypothetical protein PKD72_14945, partial [Gemmatales bacterium]|nr:hypothetical protein [Gemmatales bacterium]
SARLEKPFLSVMLSIREYPMFSQVPSDQVFAEWRAEHDRTLEEAGICLHLLKINQTLGKFPGYELLFSNKDETTFTRVYQIYDGSKLVTLTAIGSLEAVSCAVCSKAFQSLHLA